MSANLLRAMLGQGEAADRHLLESCLQAWQTAVCGEKGQWERKQRQALEARVKELEREVERLTGRCGSLDTNVAELEASLAQRRHELEEARQQLETRTGERDALSAEVERLRARVSNGSDNAGGRVAELEAQLGELLERQKNRRSPHQTPAKSALKTPTVSPHKRAMSSSEELLGTDDITATPGLSVDREQFYKVRESTLVKESAEYQKRIRFLESQMGGVPAASSLSNLATPIPSGSGADGLGNPLFQSPSLVGSVGGGGSSSFANMTNPRALQTTKDIKRMRREVESEWRARMNDALSEQREKAERQLEIEVTRLRAMLNRERGENGKEPLQDSSPTDATDTDATRINDDEIALLREQVTHLREAVEENMRECRKGLRMLVTAPKVSINVGGDEMFIQSAFPYDAIRAAVTTEILPKFQRCINVSDEVVLRQHSGSSASSSSAAEKAAGAVAEKAQAQVEGQGKVAGRKEKKGSASTRASPLKARSGTGLSSKSATPAPAPPSGMKDRLKSPTKERFGSASKAVFRALGQDEAADPKKKASTENRQEESQGSAKAAGQGPINPEVKKTIKTMVYTSVEELALSLQAKVQQLLPKAEGTCNWEGLKVSA